MGRKAFWVGDKLKDLLTLSIDELCSKYPNHARNKLITERRYWRIKMEQQPADNNELNRLSEAFKEAGLDFTPEDLAKARAGFHIGFIKNSDGEIEYTKPLPHVDFGKKDRQIPFEPVEPAIIKMSRAKIPRRDYRGIFVFSDAQIGYRRIDGELVPLHDETAISASLKLANDLRPDYVVDLGDTTDFAELSRYPVDSDHFLGTLQPSLQRTHNLYAEMTAATPGAERHAVDSNHVKRLGDFVLKNAFALFNVRGANERYPALSYPGLLKLEQIGWEWHGGYGTAEYEHSPDLTFIHGLDSVSQGSTAAKLAKKNYGRNIVQGHAHRMESQYHTDRQGNMFGAFVVGALCRRDGIVPSYYSAIDHHNQPVKHYENWQNGVMYIRDYGNGKYQFDHIPIHDGIIFYSGRKYDGRA